MTIEESMNRHPAGKANQMPKVWADAMEQLEETGKRLVNFVDA